MTAPRLEIHLDRIGANARVLVDRLAPLGVEVTGVTKASLGAPELARALLGAGVAAIGDSRIENIERMRAAGITAPMVLVRSPMPSQVDRVVAHADVSLNTEVAVLELLSAAALARSLPHSVVLMVELGDLREGILPADLVAVAQRVLDLPGLVLRGIGANLACQNGVVPDARNMAVLSGLAGVVESRCGCRLAVVSGGNSANLDWLAATGAPGRVDDLRLGEAILLGVQPLDRRPIAGLRTDAVALVAEVIESKRKPSRPWGGVGLAAFGPAAVAADRGTTTRVIVALGRQDVDPDGLVPPAGCTIVGTSSDHLVLDLGRETVPVGAEVRFGVDYSALVRAMTSPFVERSWLGGVG